MGLLRKLKVMKRWKKAKRTFIEENLEMESKGITSKRAHRTGSKINDKKRAIILNFLNYKDMDAVPNQYRQKHLWNDIIYVDEDCSEQN